MRRRAISVCNLHRRSVPYRTAVQVKQTTAAINQSTLSINCLQVWTHLAISHKQQQRTHVSIMPLNALTQFGNHPTHMPVGKVRRSSPRICHFARSRLLNTRLGRSHSGVFGPPYLSTLLFPFSQNGRWISVELGVCFRETSTHLDSCLGIRWR